MANFRTNSWLVNSQYEKKNKSKPLNLFGIFQLIGFSHIEPFVVAVWLGDSKPSCVNEYLLKFVDEMNGLIVNGIEINGIRHCVKIRAIIADTPARCFLKGANIYSSADTNNFEYTLLCPKAVN